MLGSKPHTCRFCDRKKPEVTFKKKAHAVPELIGNKTLLTFYECDDCNDRFSSFEDDFAKMTLGDRSISQARGKKAFLRA
jgi:HNH endonuclease